jgi:hypothetical protein
MRYRLPNGVDIFKGSLYGTVTSGHPTLTTLGNTLRVYLYNKYWLEMAGAKDYNIYVSGDDSLLYVKHQDVQAVT